MNSNSVTYILGFCTAVCLVCSVIVSTTAVGLKEKQEFNKELDRQKKVLSVAGLIKEGEAITAKKVRSIFSKRIKAIVVDLRKGKVDAKATQAGNFDQLKASKDPKTSRKAPKNRAGVQRVPFNALVYLVSSKDMDEKGKGFALSQYIFPVEGKGLWSTLYGFLALAPDFNTIKGLTFYQHAETPGLGGEVDNPRWKALWPNRKVFGPKGKVKVRVIKGQAGKADKDPYKVDGLSGATITSNGVTHLVKFWMSDNGFKPFIDNQKKNGGKLIPAAPAPRKAANRPAPRRTKAPAARKAPVVRKAPAVRKAAVRKAPVAARPAPVVRKAPVVVRKAAPAPVVRKAPTPVVRKAPAPVVRKAPAPAVRKAAPAPVVRKAPAPVVRKAAPAPVVRKAPAPVVRKAAPAPRAAAKPAPAKPSTQPQPRKR